MSEILKFVIENFPRLKTLDLVLIFTLVGFSVFGAYKLISGFYQKRHEAQGDLIRIKDDTITSYQRQVQVIEGERAQLEAIAAKRAKDIAELRQHLVASALQEKFSQENTNRIVKNSYALRYLLLRSQQLLGALGMCGSLKSMFAVYVASGMEKRYPDVPREGELFEAIEAIDSNILALGTRLLLSPEAIVGKPTDPIVVNDEGYDSALSSVQNNMDRLNDVFIEAFTRAYPELRDQGAKKEIT